MESNQENPENWDNVDTDPKIEDDVEATGSFAVDEEAEKDEQTRQILQMTALELRQAQIQILGKILERMNVLIDKIDALGIVISEEGWTRRYETASFEQQNRKVEMVGMISKMFPMELRKLMTFKEEEDAVLIYFQTRLSKEDFSKIWSIAKAHQAKYVSAGANSHIRMEKK